MRILKLLLSILKDERGDFGSQLMRWFGQKKRGDVPGIQNWENVPEVRERLSQNILSRIGQPRKFQLNPAFKTKQPGIEALTEKILGEKLSALPTPQEYKQQVEASKGQQIAREKERTETQKGEEQEMYNRLGLVSSTPWMARAGEIGEESLGRQRDIETEMDVYGLEYGLAADELASNIANQYISQGQILGGRQRGYQQREMEMSMEDLKRMLSEDQVYGNQALQYLGLGGVKPGQQYTRDLGQWSQPNIWDYGAQGYEDIERILMQLLQLSAGGQ